MTGEIKRLILEAPPRHSKSLHVSHYFPAWYMGHHPTHEVMFCTYAQNFANKWGRKTRNVINTKEFQSIFDARLSSDSKAANEFTLQQGGEYHALGIDGQATGKGADCLTGDTLISTTKGKIRIDRLYRCDYKVYTYDSKTKTIKTRSIKAFRRKKAKGIYKLVTSSGRVITATRDHRFYTLEKGYKALGGLECGQTLLTNRHSNSLHLLQQDSDKEGLQHKKIFKDRLQGFILLNWMFKKSSRYKKSEKVCCLQKSGIKENKKILRKMQDRTKDKKFKTINLSLLQTIVFEESLSSKILQHGMQKQSSFKDDVREKKPKIFRRKSLQNIVSKIKTNYFAKRFKYLCCLWRIKEKKSLSSYRSQQTQQCCGESNNSLFKMSCNPSSIETDTISTIEKISDEEHQVYDIQIEGESNFFANEILVHNCAIIDDPYKNRKDAESALYRENVREFFNSALYTRLSPKGRIVVMMCLTGDTKILMSDGTEKELKSINLGDLVISYDDGKVSVAKVLRWADQGLDDVFEIKMKSGVSVKGNKRHPFLVKRGYSTEWVKIQNLKVGDEILRVKKECGKVLNAKTTNVKNQQNAKDIACSIITKTDGQTDTDHLLSIQNLVEQQDLSIDMELPLNNMNKCLNNKKENALFANSPQTIMCEPIGAESFVSITAMKQEKLEGFCATTAISLLDMEKQNKFLFQHLNTYEIIPDKIIDIVYAGKENVFDVQIEGTENFIANGLVSHNTRWHEDDLINTLLEADEYSNENWVRLRFPAVNEDESECLWPDRFPLERIMQIKKTVGIYNWNSLFLQRPSAREGNIFKREWWRYYRILPARFDKVIQSWDLAFKDKKRNKTNKGSDYVVGQIWGKLGPNYYLIAQLRGQIDIIESCNAILKMTNDHPTSRIKLIEDKANGPATMQLLKNKVAGLTPVNPCDSKTERAEALKYLVQGGNVYLPLPASESWVNGYIDEFSDFPNGKNDDMVDASTQAWEYLEGSQSNRLEKLLQM